MTLSTTLQTSRRSFLKGSAALAGATLVVGYRADGALAAADTAADLNPFVRIEPDGTVVAIVKHFEMGQGTTTGLTTLIAEELDADWARVVPEFAPANSEIYGNLFFGGQGTGGSTAMANSFMQYRQAAAGARAVLMQAAAEAWGVSPGEVTIEGGVLKAGGKSAHFGEFAAAAAALPVPAEAPVKSPEQFRLIGKDGLPRKDSSAKTDGTAIFAMDVKLPGMVYAVVLTPPKFGGLLTGFDASGASEVPGFLDARPLADNSGLAVYATGTWAAIQAREAISAEWDFSGAETRSTDALMAYHEGLLDEPQYVVRGDEGVAEAIGGAARTIEAEFRFPFLAHASMEPLNCVVEPTEGGVRFHDGCQFPGIVQPTIGHLLGVDPAKVEVVTVYAGGSFGRRATPKADYHVQAALAFQAWGGDAPVKMVWTREDDMRGGYYRPMAAHRARIGLDADGRIAGWDHRLAVKSILKGSPFEAMIENGVDATSVEGIGDTHYALPAMSVGLTDAEYGVPVLWWRSVGHTHTAYTMETLMDMAAEAAGADPVEFRLGYLPGDDADQRRLAGVLKLAAEKAGWGSAPEGRFQGVAVHKSFNTYVAEVVEISLADGAVKVEKVTCAVDCGIAVNPDVIRAQMEGGIGYGLGAVMRNTITLTDGEVDQWNFPDYEPLRMSDMPDIEVHIVASDEAPTGVGEPGVPPVGPALANAIYAATGTRVTTLPMTESGVSFA